MSSCLIEESLEDFVVGRISVPSGLVDGAMTVFRLAVLVSLISAEMALDDADG